MFRKIMKDTCKGNRKVVGGRGGFGKGSKGEGVQGGREILGRTSVQSVWTSEDYKYFLNSGP